ATYFCACLPVGYRALYRIGASLWDPAAISKVLPYILLVVTVVAVAAAARRLAGYFGAFLAAALVLSSSIFLAIMVGGLPRAFALILLPELLGSRAYGRFLGPRDVTEYPEIGPEGRYGTVDRPPFKTFPEAALEQARILFWPVGKPWSKKVQEWAKVRAYPGANANGDVIL